MLNDENLFNGFDNSIVSQLGDMSIINLISILNNVLISIICSSLVL